MAGEAANSDVNVIAFLLHLLTAAPGTSRHFAAMQRLSRLSETDMLPLLAAAGFTGERAAKNIGHNQSRMAFTARPT